MKLGSSRLLVDAALLGLLAATVVVVVASVPVVRPFVVLAAACLVPGGALLTRLSTGERLTDLGLAIGLSLAVDTAGSLVLAWSHWWHPELLGVALAAASAALLASDIARAARR